MTETSPSGAPQPGAAPLSVAPPGSPDSGLPDSGLVVGPDGRARCFWGVSTPDYVAYHDHEWGRPVRGDDALFERMCLEAFQSGLAWITILRKRAAFRAAFDGFAIAKVAAYGEADAARLLADAGIVRNRMKIDAALHNARVAARPAGGPVRPALGFRSRAARHAAGQPGADTGDHRRVHRHGQGAQAARVPIRRADHGVCADAGDRHGRRPRGGLLGAADAGCRGCVMGWTAWLSGR